MKTKSILSMLFAAVLSAGCETRVAEGPPVVRYGQDECVHCGMILNEERHAAAISVVGAGGAREDLLFDDIGDLLEYERKHPELTVHRRYVHDLDTRQWIDATTATIVRLANLHTPMGSGLAAFASPEAAHLARKNLGAGGGELMNWSQLVKSRREDTRKPCCPGEHNDSESASNQHAGR